jgi:hypothetical protein
VPRCGAARLPTRSRIRRRAAGRARRVVPALDEVFDGVRQLFGEVVELGRILGDVERVPVLVAGGGAGQMPVTASHSPRMKERLAHAFLVLLGVGRESGRVVQARAETEAGEIVGLFSVAVGPDDIEMVDYRREDL